MIEDKVKNFKELVAQAKTLRERFKEAQGYPLNYNVVFIRRDGKAGDDGKLDEPLVSVVGLQQTLSVLQEKEQALRKLLENRPKISAYRSLKTNTDVKRYLNDLDGWFEVFVGEFEGLKKIIGDDKK